MTKNPGKRKEVIMMAGRPSNNSPQTKEEMALEARASRQTKVYAGRGETIAYNDGKISALVSDLADGLSNIAYTNENERIRLKDSEAVKKITIIYVKACAENASLPTMSGLAKAIGCSRQSLYDHMQRYPDDETTAWLADFSDSCAECMMQAALSGSVATIPAIFIAKSRYNWRDALVIENIPPAMPDSPLTAEEIQEKYDFLPDE